MSIRRCVFGSHVSCIRLYAAASLPLATCFGADWIGGLSPFCSYWLFFVQFLRAPFAGDILLPVSRCLVDHVAAYFNLSSLNDWPSSIITPARDCVLVLMWASIAARRAAAPKAVNCTKNSLINMHGSLFFKMTSCCCKGNIFDVIVCSTVCSSRGNPKNFGVSTCSFVLKHLEFRPSQTWPLEFRPPLNVTLDFWDASLSPRKRDLGVCPRKVWRRQTW